MNQRTFREVAFADAHRLCFPDESSQYLVGLSAIAPCYQVSASTLLPHKAGSRHGLPAMIRSRHGYPDLKLLVFGAFDEFKDNLLSKPIIVAIYGIFKFFRLVRFPKLSLR